MNKASLYYILLLLLVLTDEELSQSTVVHILSIE